MESAFRKHYGNTQLNAVCSAQKRKNHREENKQHREECSPQETGFFAPSANVFQMQKQDGFEQQNSGSEQSLGLKIGNGLGTREGKIIVFIVFPVTCQGCFKRKHASRV